MGNDEDAPDYQAAGRRFWRGAAVVIALLLVAALGLIAVEYLGIVPIGRQQNPGPAPAPVTIDPARDGIDCLRDAAWSPDGATIAIVGDTGACADPSHRAPVVLNRYDAATGKLLQTIPLDALLTGTALGLAGTTPAVVTGVIWSADGQRLALDFLLLGPPAPQGTTIAAQGVAILNADGSQPRALLQSYAAGDQPGGWNLATGQFIAPPGASSLGTLPAAPAYQWSGDMLAPAGMPYVPGSTPAVSATPGPVGDPAGGGNFTLWQPGTLEYLVIAQPGGTAYASGVFTWVATFGAWSPDGHVVIPYGALGGRILPANTTPPAAATLAAFNLAQSPVLPVRDAALQTVANTMAATSAGNNALVSLAWRPDGRYLAAYGLSFGGALTIFDTQTGAQSAQFTPATAPAPLTGTPRLLRWSPDGRRVLLITSDSGQASIWNLASLP